MGRKTRLVACAVSTFIAFFAVTSSLGNVIVRVDPQTALLLSPENAQIEAAYASNTYLNLSTQRERDEALLQARSAIIKDATAVDGLLTLAIDSEIDGDRDRAADIFEHVSRLTRREYRAQIWAIEEAVARGDITQAIKAYDLALRVSEQGRRVLFPVLAKAINESKIRRQLIDVLGTRPIWEKEFVNYLVANPAEPEALIALFNEGEGAGITIDSVSRSKIVDALYDSEKADAAWAYYRSFRGIQSADSSRDPEFTYEGDGRSTFDWRASDAPEVYAAINPAPEGGTVEFTFPSSGLVKVLEQGQRLPPGRYRFRATGSSAQNQTDANPFWIITCANGSEVARINLPEESGADWQFAGIVEIPRDCFSQNLALMLRPVSGFSNGVGIITSAQIKRVASGRD
ncbi:hypothetical protein [Qipengyuania atrilutea]|uniref:Uncharacterized protein n=1 Tax=Qipengyuania atrilutea TaxID=2744473 RepID=A0A850H5J7_9SPHN|nr:hypothetical protein [Actirhodobacter atriluteus]NVD44395.1 hypothetical protein [Actirhodobacter atriluteus]